VERNKFLLDKGIGGLMCFFVAYGSALILARFLKSILLAI
jgi:hypothetical protein